MRSGVQSGMLPLEKTFIDALLRSVEEPSEENKHVAAETLRNLLIMYQEDTLQKAAATSGKAASAEAG